MECAERLSLLMPPSLAWRGRTAPEALGGFADGLDTTRHRRQYELAQVIIRDILAEQQRAGALGDHGGMLPLLRGEKREPHASLAWFWSRNRAIRQGQWKLVWDSGVREWELYDLDADRCETDDLAQKHPQRTERMAADWHVWAKNVGLSGKSQAPRKKDKSKSKSKS